MQENLWRCADWKTSESVGARELLCMVYK
jgi:hypothetical protein